MGEIIKETLEAFHITKDIQERNTIIQSYISYGILDRNKAIEKIRELQVADSDITAATIAMQAAHGYVILEQADDNILIENLRFQINILESKLITKTIKNVTEESK